MIDDFRLRGARTWRRRGGHLTKGGWRTQVAHQVAHAFANHNASLSKGEPSPLWSRLCAGIRIGRGLARLPHVGRDNRGGAAPGVSPPGPVRRTWRGRKWRERPGLFAADAPQEGARPDRPPDTLPPSFRGRSLHSDPCREGKRAPLNGGSAGRSGQVAGPFLHQTRLRRQQKLGQFSIIGRSLIQEDTARGLIP